MFKASSLPLNDDLEALNTEVISKMIMDINSGNCELTVRAPGQLTEFISQAALTLAIRWLDKKYEDDKPKL